MKTLIRLKIEKLKEQGQEYFIATSDDLQGLIAEGDTIEQAIEIAEDIALILLDLEKEQKKFKARSIPDDFEYSLILEI